MKSFFSITILSCLLVIFVFGEHAMGQNGFVTFSADMERMGVLLSAEATHPEKLNAQTLRDAIALLPRITKQLQQICESDNDTDAEKALEIIRSSPPPFGGMRLYLPDRNPLHRALEQTFELLEQFNNQAVKVQRKLLKKKIDKVESNYMPELLETAKMSNKSGVPIIADFYASSENSNVALSPPNMVATYAALAHIAQGKTKEELQKLLSLEGNEKPAFGAFNYYLRNIIANDEPDRPYGYTSNGYFIVNANGKNIDDAAQQELMDKYATLFLMADSSETKIHNFNGYMFQEFGGELLEHDSSFFPRYSFNHRLMRERRMGKASDDDVYNIIKADRNMSMIVRSIAGSMDTLPDREIGDDEEPSMGEPRSFMFDAGIKTIDFFKVEVKEHQTVTMNGQSGYRVPLGVTDLTVVKCSNGAALKQLAGAIASDGLQIQVGRKISQPAMLYIPQVDFDTELDLKQYAQTKGLTSPFTKGTAEFSLGTEGALEGGYCNDAKIACTFMVDCYGIIAWQQIIPDAVVRAYPLGRNQRLPNNNIVIDSPYLMVITDRKLDAVLGMAFIADPKQSEARKEFDRGFIFARPPQAQTQPNIPSPPPSPEGASDTPKPTQSQGDNTRKMFEKVREFVESRAGTYSYSRTGAGGHISFTQSGYKIQGSKSKIIALWYGADRSYIQVWDATTEEELCRLEKPMCFSCAEVSDDGTKIATIESNLFYAIHVWDAKTGRQLHEFKAPTGADRLSFSADGKTVTAWKETRDPPNRINEQTWSIATQVQMPPQRQPQPQQPRTGERLERAARAAALGYGIYRTFGGR